MKKVTMFLISLLALLVAVMYVFRVIGVTEPLNRSARHENEIVSMNTGEQQTAMEDTVQSEPYAESVVLPAYYNSIDSGKINRTRDQGDLGSCWAFAANAALESRLLPKEAWDFSEDHMIWNNGFRGDADSGGDYFMAVAYLSSWKGPVPEEEDPYNDGMTNENAHVVKHLQEVLFIDGADPDVIKNMIYEYGAVESSIHMAVDDEKYIDSTYYDPYNFSYCYNGEEDANHEIVIIGWDDAYLADNFTTGAYADGAYICMNSWGTEFGDYGVFYVSYCDSRIAEAIEVYSVLEDTDNYDHIYQNDVMGWVGRMGFEEPSAFFANVYTSDGNEDLSAVSFYATGDNTEYKIYVVENYESEKDLLTRRNLYKEGTFTYSGYYTVDLDAPVQLAAGERFAVVVEITTPGSLHPIAVEMDAQDGRTGTVMLDGRESYVSSNGRAWSNTQQEAQGNVCLKAFTKDR